MELACRHNKNQTQTVIMLTREHQSCQGIVRINCKPLDSAELRRLDKNERGLVTFLSNLTKGEKKRAVRLNLFPPPPQNDFHRFIKLTF